MIGEPRRPQQPGRPGEPRQPDRGRVLPRPEPIRDRRPIEDIHRDRRQRVIQHPRMDDRGHHLPHRHVVGAPRHEHITIINNPTIINRIAWHHRYETRRNHHYWHDYGGHRYSHYYDTWGYHWYGWYVGSHYFWVRHYYDRWWWYDPYYDRWCHWRNGSWWWQDPSRHDVVYIYRDHYYYRWDNSRGGVVVRPDPTPPVTQPPVEPLPTPNEASFYSEDGTRLVQVYGDKKGAFLYGVPSEGEQQFLAHLADHVLVDYKAESGKEQEGVQFLSTETGLLILVKFEEQEPDGSWKKLSKLFDQDGKPFVPSQPTPRPPSEGPPGEGGSSSAGEGLGSSQSFRMLKDGAPNW